MSKEAKRAAFHALAMAAAVALIGAPSMLAGDPAAIGCKHTIRGRSRRDGKRFETCCSCGAQRVDGGPWTKPEVLRG